MDDINIRHANVRFHGMNKIECYHCYVFTRRTTCLCSHMLLCSSHHMAYKQVSVTFLDTYYRRLSTHLHVRVCGSSVIDKEQHVI
jgi:hypothetical protein